MRFETVSNEATFTVTILDDDIVECPEEFSLELAISPNTGKRGVIKGTPSSATVTIRDTDCEYYSCSITQPAHLLNLCLSTCMDYVLHIHIHLYHILSIRLFPPLSSLSGFTQLQVLVSLPRTTWSWKAIQCLLDLK